MNDKIKNQAIETFFEGVLELKTVEECRAFFNDSCTVKELESMAQRLQVANMLFDSKTYIEIGSATGASTATISRVNRALSYGADGFKLIIKRLKEKR